MYVPTHFEESRPEVLHDLIKRHPFGTLITHGANGLAANHLPFELNSQQGTMGVLSAHVARSNSVWQHVSNGDEVLAVFLATDAYISPNWYPSKHEFHNQVPTWNYMVAHAYGRIRILDDERFVRGVVARLTRTHEASQPTPWKMTDSTKEDIDAMLQRVVGVEIEITHLIGKSKLSQNEEVRDIHSAGEALKAQGDHMIGDAMLACAHAKSK